jgi:hypothetical protein
MTAFTTSTAELGVLREAVVMDLARGEHFDMTEQGFSIDRDAIGGLDPRSMAPVFKLTHARRRAVPGPVLMRLQFNTAQTLPGEEVPRDILRRTLVPLIHSALPASRSSASPTQEPRQGNARALSSRREYRRR